MMELNDIICPFCEEGALKQVLCPHCGTPFLRCDECDSIYKDRESLEKEYDEVCPHCDMKLGS